MLGNRDVSRHKTMRPHPARNGMRAAKSSVSGIARALKNFPEVPVFASCCQEFEGSVSDLTSRKITIASLVDGMAIMYTTQTGPDQRNSNRLLIPKTAQEVAYHREVFAPDHTSIGSMALDLRGLKELATDQEALSELAYVRSIADLNSAIGWAGVRLGQSDSAAIYSTPEA